MAETYGFFNANQKSDGSYDRTYNASDFANYFSTLVSNGVFANPADSLKVNITGNTELTVSAGKAFIQGYWYVLDEDKSFSYTITNELYGKYILIKLRLSLSDRAITLVSETASTVSVTRNNDVFELLLATLGVQSGSSKFSAKNLVDQRGSANCGYVAGFVENIDVGTMFDNYGRKFNEWFANVQNQLSTDAAGNLQNQIDVIEGRTAVLRRYLNKLYFVKNTQAADGSAIYYHQISASNYEYPDGFTNSNCYVKSVMYTTKTSEASTFDIEDSRLTWRYAGETGILRYSDGVRNRPASIGVALTKDYIGVLMAIEETNYPAFEESFLVKIVLEKYKD